MSNCQRRGRGRGPAPSQSQPAPSQSQPAPSQPQPTSNDQTPPSNRTIRFEDDDDPPVLKPKRSGNRNQAATVDLFEEIRNEKPEYLKVPITHSKSTKSRPPKFFDMHLHESLRLKNIVFLDNLPKALSDVFEENLGQDPSNQHCWVEQQEIRVNAIRNESDLAHHYRDIIAHKHMAVASKLKFGKHPIFRWGISPSVPESMTRVVEAVGDGFIFVNPAAVKDLSATEQKNFKLLEDYGLVNFAVWELKNLVCGPKVMKEIPNLEGPFLWKACGERSEDDQVSSHCDSAIKTHRVNGNLVETGRRTGPDSSLARAMINKATSSEPSRVGSKRKESLSIPERAAAKRRKPQLKRTTPEPQHKSKNKKLPIVDARELIQQGWTEAVVEDATFIIFSAGNEEYIGIRDRESQTLYLSGVIKPSQQADPNYGKIHVGLCIVAYDDAVDRVQKLSEGKTPWRWDLNLEKQPVFAARPKVTPDSNLTTTAQGDFDANILKSLRECQRIDIRYHVDGRVKKESRKATKAVNPRNSNTWYLKRDESEVPSESDDVDDGEDSIDGSRTPVDYRLDERGSEEDLDNSESENSDEYQESDGSEGGDAPENFHNLPEASHNSARPRLYLDFEEFHGERVYHVYLGQKSAGSSKGINYSEPLFVKTARQNHPQRKAELLREYRNYKKLRKPETNAAVVEVYGLFSYKLRSNDKWYFLIMANGGDTLDEVGESAVLAYANKYESNYREALETFHSKNWVHNFLDSAHMLLHPRTKEVKMISLSVCARHRADRFSEAAQCDLNIVDDFFNRDESQATASQATATQETNHGEEYSDDSGGN